LSSQQLRHLQSTESKGEALAPVAPGDDIQGIRGGFALEATEWFVVFEGNPLCGGALIQPDIVLTSAACVEGGFPQAVRIGSQTRAGGLVVSVESFRIHPNWNGDVTQGADIAVLKLADIVANEVAEYNTDVGVPVVTSDILFTMGYGIINDSGTEPALLQGLFLNYKEDCFSSLSHYNPEFFVCGDATPEYGTCTGDGGGPVVLSGTKTVVGIDSHSDGTCETQTVDVYTRVSSYSGWIENKICELSIVPPSLCDTETSSDDSGDIWCFLQLFSRLFV
jgi:trypsin